MLRRYLMIAVFGSGLLLGIQAPNFIDQYGHRIDAHFREVSENLRGFQEIADRFHGGDLRALVRHHRSNPDSTFRAEAEPIERMAARKARFAREKAALESAFPLRALHVLLRGDRETLDETYAGYSTTLRLDRLAVFSGLAAALAACLALELLYVLGRRILGPS